MLLAMQTDKVPRKVFVNGFWWKAKRIQNFRVAIESENGNHTYYSVYINLVHFIYITQLTIFLYFFFLY